MWRSMFVSETIIRRSIRLLKRIERFGWSKLIQTNVNELDVDIFMNLTHQVWFAFFFL